MLKGYLCSRYVISQVGTEDNLILQASAFHWPASQYCKAPLPSVRSSPFPFSSDDLQCPSADQGEHMAHLSNGGPFKLHKRGGKGEAHHSQEGSRHQCMPELQVA